MCSTDPFQFRWLKGYIYSSCYYHHQIGSINLSHCYHVFLWSCVWDVCYIIFCHVLHKHSGKTGILFSSLLCSLWWLQLIVGYVMACRLYSFVCTLHHLIIIIVQTNLQTLNLWNVCQIYFVECVSKIEHILLVIHYSIYGAVCFQFTQFPRDGWENIILFYYHHQIGSMNYYPLFRVRSWNNGKRSLYSYGLTLIPVWISLITSIIKCGMKLIIHSQISTVQILEMTKKSFHSTFYGACDYLSLLGLKSI